MRHYGYCRAAPGLPDEWEQISAIESSGVKGQYIYLDRQGSRSLPYRPEYSDLKSVLKERDVLVICGLWALGESYREIAQEWDDLTRLARCEIEVLDCPLLSTRAYSRESERTLMRDICCAALSQLAYMEREKNPIGRPRIEKPSSFSEVYKQVREHQITNQEAMRLLGLKANTYYKFVHEEKGRI